jgi:hypothetical protein
LILLDSPSGASAAGLTEGRVLAAGACVSLAAGREGVAAPAAPDFTPGGFAGVSPFLLKMENATMFRL